MIIDAVSKIDGVLSIGKSGGEKLPENNESDIDIFVFCEDLPDINKRETAINDVGISISMNLSESCGRFWGVCDYITVENITICLMYFTAKDVDNDIKSVLDGSRLDMENEYYYPTGQCATFLTMHILYDKNNYISDMKKRLSIYPPRLSTMLIKHHIEKINDEEDFERAVSRGDVLFYHSTLAGALDHFLQSLFALIRCFFPSRKRTLQHIEGFIKPQKCSERLLKVIESGSKSATLSQSYAEWSALCEELITIISKETNG